MVLTKMDLYKYHNVYMYFSSWLLVPIPQQVAWSVAMTVYEAVERESAGGVSPRAGGGGGGN